MRARVTDLRFFRISVNNCNFLWGESTGNGKLLDQASYAHDVIDEIKEAGAETTCHRTPQMWTKTFSKNMELRAGSTVLFVNLLSIFSATSARALLLCTVISRTRPIPHLGGLVLWGYCLIMFALFVIACPSKLYMGIK